MMTLASGLARSTATMAPLSRRGERGKVVMFAYILIYCASGANGSSSVAASCRRLVSLTRFLISRKADLLVRFVKLAVRPIELVVGAHAGYMMPGADDLNPVVRQDDVEDRAR